MKDLIERNRFMLSPRCGYSNSRNSETSKLRVWSPVQTNAIFSINYAFLTIKCIYISKSRGDLLSNGVGIRAVALKLTENELSQYGAIFGTLGPRQLRTMRFHAKSSHSRILRSSTFRMNTHLWESVTSDQW